MTYSILSKLYPSELLFKLQCDQKSATSVQIAVLSVTCLAPSWWLVGWWLLVTAVTGSSLGIHRDRHLHCRPAPVRSLDRRSGLQE